MPRNSAKERTEMTIIYKISIPEPHTHYVKVSLELERVTNAKNMTFFMPAWSPGSYLVREYSRHIRGLRASSDKGARLFVKQTDKNHYFVDFDHPEFKSDCKKFVIDYEIYCNELTVRTAHVDTTHAFLHGPAVFLGVCDVEMKDLEVHLDFPPLWSHVSTTLKDISKQREKFIYSAKDFDELLDSPIEIGCQETDGFMFDKKEHWWIYWGALPPMKWNLKEDIKKIVETVAAVTGETPYEKYMFMAHFAPGLYGGLEHADSTVLAYDPFKMVERKGYLDWLSLVAHEYFHVWNVKRIRPKALGPFDYSKENYTNLLWLSEGMTVFMDELLVARSGLSTLSEYLEQQKNNINRMLATPGRKFHSLEESSFNTWIKLYRPDENSVNSTVSYYLKGGLVFFVLNAWMAKEGKSVDDFIKALWSDYKARPQTGLEDEEVFKILETVAGKKIAQNFSHLVSTTDELPLDEAAKLCGLEIVYEQSPKPWTGMDVRYDGGRVIVDKVYLDGPAMKEGLNVGDELISMGGLRVLKGQWEKNSEWLNSGTHYETLVARHGRLHQLSLTPGSSPRAVKEIKVLDETQAKLSLGLK
tara:strand:+ start:6111 stop:7868 length:1758 start_codon:yes stop_codon:yes gene_type:complete